MSKKYTYEEFVDIINTLRSENGCPWDREQTHESLRPCLMEEAAEVLAAIRILKETGNGENLQEELGDVLLQVVMHAQIAKEEGLFTMEDVVNDVAAKMVRRHPHVFGTIEVEGSDEVLQNWEEIKKKEKEGKSWVASPLKEVPRELPALTRAPKVLKKADKFYDRHGSLGEDMTLMSESIKALEQAAGEADKKALEAEVGNILMALSDIARLYKLPLEQILADRIDDFIEEYES
ncbi:MAG: MazG family protein [Lachnospiraceae bacterium]